MDRFGKFLAFRDFFFLIILVVSVRLWLMVVLDYKITIRRRRDVISLEPARLGLNNTATRVMILLGIIKG